MGRDIARVVRVGGERREVHHIYTLDFAIISSSVSVCCLSVYNELAVPMIKHATYKTPHASDNLGRLFNPTVTGRTITLSLLYLAPPRLGSPPVPFKHRFRRIHKVSRILYPAEYDFVSCLLFYTKFSALFLVPSFLR